MENTPVSPPVAFKSTQAIPLSSRMNCRPVLVNEVYDLFQYCSGGSRAPKSERQPLQPVDAPSLSDTAAVGL